MAERRVQPRTEISQGEEARAPITIVPTRRTLEDREVVQLREGLRRAQTEIASLQDYFRSIRIPPTERTAQDLTAEAERLDQAVRGMALLSNPVLGERYRDELDLVNSRIRAARTAAREGRIGAAVEQLDQVNAQVSVLGQVFEIELGILINGVPSNIRLQGIAPENAMNMVFDGLESVVFDYGTRNEARGRAVIRAGRLYVSNASVLNADNQLATGERNNIFGFVADRGQSARSNAPYEQQQQNNDDQQLSSFERNIEALRNQLKDYNVSVFTGWRNDILSMIQLERDDQTKRNLETLQTDIEGVLRRVRAGQEVSQDEIRDLTARYFMQSGRSPPLSEDERTERMRDSATALRGTGRTVTEGSPEWYGQRSLDFLGQGNSRMASLAYSVGLLERAAGRSGAAAHLEDYWDIRDMIARSVTPPPALMSRYAAQIEASTIGLDVERIRREFATGGVREKRERVLATAEIVQQRLAAGDAPGARRLLDMLSIYTDLLGRNRTGTWNGSDQMETSIDNERNGRNGADQFGNALSYYSVSNYAQEAREGMRSWGRGVNDQKQAAEAAIARVEELARGGNIIEARRVLTLVFMYVDSVQKLGVRRGNQIVSLNDADTVTGMTNAMGALARGESRIGTRNVAEVFTESNTAAQTAYVTREADRLTALTTRREFGREDTKLALTRARERSAQGDFRGALILLEFVREFYGSPQAGVDAVFRQEGGRRIVVTPAVETRSEGWRYDLFAGRGAGGIRGYTNGRRGLLEAIRLEMNASDDRTHIAAAQLFDQNTRLLSETQYLLGQHLALTQRFTGVIPFVNDRMETQGQIPLGELQANGRYTDYIPLDYIRQYERNHPQDPLLRGGRTIDQILSFVEGAAATGDRVGYNWWVGQLNARFEVAVRRSIRQRAIDQMRTQSTQLRTAITEIRNNYTGEGFNGLDVSQRTTAINALDQRLQALQTRLGVLETNEEEIPLTDFASLVGAVNSEARITATISFLNEQIKLNEQFRRAVAAERGDLPARTASRIREAGAQLEEARRAIIRGDLPAAFTAYRSAVSIKTDALIFYRAEETPTLAQVDLLRPLPRPRDEDLYHVPGAPAGDNIDTRFFPVLRFQRASEQFEPYRIGSLETFSGLLTGFSDGFLSTRNVDAQGQPDIGETVSLNSAPRRALSQADLERRARATSMIEISTFGCPQSAPRSIILSDYVPLQNAIRAEMNEVLTGRMAGAGGRPVDVPTLATLRFSQADGQLRQMQARAERDDKIATYTMIGVGLACIFIPEVGWAISGAIFVGLAADRVATEYRVDGHASTEAWVMLGLSVGTLGLAGAAQGLGRLALASRAAGYTRLATGLSYTATGMRITGFGIGIGLSGYGIYTGIRALRAGRTEEGLVNLGLALFPLVHMGGSALMSYRARVARPTVTTEITEALDTATSGDRIPVQIRITEPDSVARAREFQQNPRSLLDFIADYMGRDTAGRAAMMEGLPSQLRPVVEGLLQNRAVAEAARTMRAGGPVDLAAFRLVREAIRGLDIATEPPPLGTIGTRVQADTYGLTSLEGLRRFVADLLVPDGAAQPALNARAAARARLAAIRAQNPDAATVIDDLVRPTNNAVRNDIATGETTAFSRAMWNRAMKQLGNLPDDVAASQQQAQLGYERQLAMAVGYDGPLAIDVPVEVPGEPVRQPIRASGGGDGSGPTGPRVRPSPIVGAGGTRVDVGNDRPAPRAPRQTGQPAEPTQAGVDPNSLLRPGEPGRAPGRMTMLWRRIQAFRATRAADREARALRQATPEDFLTEAKAGINETMSMVGRASEVPRLVDEATRGMDADAAAQVGNDIRSAPQRMAELVKALYRRATTRGTPRPQVEAARRAMVRMYSYENVRGSLGEIARTDPELAQALRMSELSARDGAARAGLSLDNFLSRASREGINNDELDSIMRTVESNNTARLSQARARVSRLETVEIPRAQEQYDSARRAAEVATGRAKTRADARVQSLGERLVELRSEMDRQRRFINADENRPLATTERLLGMRLRPSERAPTLLRMQEAGIIPADAVLSEGVQAGERAVRALRAIDSHGNAVVERIRQVMDRNLGNNGQSSEESVLAALRSDEVADAVRAQHGERTAAMFRQAVAEGNLDAVMRSLGERLPSDVSDGISSFSRIARASLAEDMSAMSILNDSMVKITQQAMEGAGLYGRELAPLRTRVGDWWGQSWARRGLRFLYDVPIRGQWRFLRSGMDIIREAPPEATMTRLGGWGRIGLQVLIWGVEGYYAQRYIRGVYHTMSGAATEEEGIRLARQQWGAEVSGPNARFIRSERGAEFNQYLPNRFPTREDVRPGSIEILRQQWDRDEIIPDPTRFNEILDDGRQMSDRLDEINNLLQQRRTGSTEDQQRATTRLNEILRGFNMTLASVDQLLTRENKQALDITDLTDLRIPDWTARGIVVHFRDMIVETFLTETGVQHTRGDTTSRFFLEQNAQSEFVNRGAFEFLWQAFQRGNIPAVYVQDAIATLSAQGVMDGLKARVNARTSLDSLLREALIASHTYIEVPGAAGSVSGIMQNSFFGLLDRRTVADPAHGWSEQQAAAARAATRQILLQYRDNPQAMTALNNFHTLEGDNGEDIYGDPAQLAQLIIQNPQNAVDLARQRGFVGPALLTQVDPAMRNAPADLVRFVREHSQDNQGLMEWIRQRRQQITSLVPILQDLSTTQIASTMSIANIQAYADRQADRYKQQGWWRGPTPSEVAAAQSAAQQRAPTPPGGRGQGPQTRDQQIQDTNRSQYGRRPGFEVATPRRTDDQGMQAAPVPTVVELSTQGEAFFASDRASGLGVLIDTMVDRMFDDQNRQHQPTPDAQLMRQVYGEDRDLAKRRIKAEIYRLMTSTNERDVTLRGGWGITTTGNGDQLTVTLDMRRARDSLRNHINEFVRGQRQNAGGR